MPVSIGSFLLQAAISTIKFIVQGRNSGNSLPGFLKVTAKRVIKVIRDKILLPTKKTPILMNSNLYLTFQNATQDARKLRRIFFRGKKPRKPKIEVLSTWVLTL